MIPERLIQRNIKSTEAHAYVDTATRGYHARNDYSPVHKTNETNHTIRKFSCYSEMVTFETIDKQLMRWSHQRIFKQWKSSLDSC